MTVIVFPCLQCGLRDHAAANCPKLPDDLVGRMKHPGFSDKLQTEWNDVVHICVPEDAGDDVVFVGVRDAESGQSATAALDIASAARVGAELTLAAYLGREHGAKT